MKFLKSELIIVSLASLIIGLISTYHWFSGGTILYYWDTLFPLDSKFSIQTFFYNWNPINFPGYSGNGWSWIPYSFSIAALLSIFKDPSLVQRFLYVSFIFLSLINFYYFSKYLLRTILGVEEGKAIYKFVGFLFSILYSFNIYTFYYSYFMFNPQIYIYCLLPLHILALFKIYPLSKEKKSDKRNLWIIIFFISLFFMTPGFTTYVFLQQYLMLLFFYLFFYWFLFNKKFISYKTLSLVSFFFLAIIINWWWFFPSLLGFKDLYDSQSSLGTTVYFDIGSIRSNLLNSLRLYGSPMMNNNPFSWDPFFNLSPLFTFPLFFFPFLIIFLLLKIRTIHGKNIILFLLVIFLLTLFIVKLGNPPLAWITKFAFEHVPFFGAFRDAWHKAGLYYVFSYFGLSLLGFGLLVRLLLDGKRKYLVVLSTSLLIIASIVATSPFFLFAYDNIKKIDFIYQGKKHTISAKTKIPPEYTNLKSYLSNKCDGPVLVIPRSSMISSAAWGKYETSYVGQDILTRFINCNFISSQMLNNGPDSFTFAPYILLNNGDFISYKNFLLQNQIRLILVRKDNVPYYFTNYIKLSKADPLSAIKFMDEDGDFEKKFQNDYFILYELKTEKLQTLGFSIPSVILFTNSSLDKGDDYAVLSKQIPITTGTVIFNKNTQLKMFSDDINYYSPVANCIGCVKISSLLTGASAYEGLLSTLKANVKKLIGKNKGSSLRQEEKISLSIIASNNMFSRLMRFLSDGNIELVRKSLSEYMESFENTTLSLESFNADFFTLNNKYMEYKNFFEPHFQKLSKYILDTEAIKESDVLKDNQLRGKILYLISLGNSKLKEMDKVIWQTNFEKKEYRMRLDIPYRGRYSCFVESKNSGITIKGVYFSKDENSQNLVQSGNMDMAIEVSGGSHPITIKYDVDEPYRSLGIKQSYGDYTEARLGMLDNGKYNFKLNVPSAKDGKFAVILTRGRLNGDVLRDTQILDQDKIVFADIVSLRSLVEGQYKKIFTLGELESREYFLYLMNMSPYLISELEYKDILVERAAENGDIQLYCSLGKVITKDTDKDFKVKKINPVKYEITLPKNLSHKFITFNQTFNKDWQATTIVNGKKHELYHFENGYANGWYIDNMGSGIVTVEFTRQKLIVLNGILTLFIFFVVLGYYMIIKEKE